MQEARRSAVCQEIIFLCFGRWAGANGNCRQGHEHPTIKSGSNGARAAGDDSHEITETTLENATARVLLAGTLVFGVERECEKKKSNDTPHRRKRDKKAKRKYPVFWTGTGRWTLQESDLTINDVTPGASLWYVASSMKLGILRGPEL